MREEKHIFLIIAVRALLVIFNFLRSHYCVCLTKRHDAVITCRAHRGKGLAAFLKAIGYLIPLMDNESANYYTREVMVILIREFQSPDEEMKKIVLKV